MTAPQIIAQIVANNSLDNPAWMTTSGPVSKGIEGKLTDIKEHTHGLRLVLGKANCYWQMPAEVAKSVLAWWDMPVRATA